MNQHHTQVIRKQKHRVLKPAKYSQPKLARKDSSPPGPQDCRPLIRKKSIRSRASSKGRDLTSVCRTERRSQRRRLLKVNSTVMRAEVHVDGADQHTTRRLFDAQARQIILQTIDEADSKASHACKEKMLKRCIGQFERALGRVQSRAKMRNRRLKEQADTCKSKENLMAELEGLQFQSVQIMPRSTSSKRISSKRASSDASQSIELKSNFLKMKAGKGYIKAMNPFREPSSESSHQSVLQNMPLQFERTAKERTQESSVMALSISEIKQERDSILTVFNRLEPFRIQ